MAGKPTTLDSELFVRRCVRCGHSGDAMLSIAPACPRCGCDLRRRPARSYAEMEGLDVAPAADPGGCLLTAEMMPTRSRESRCVQRWLLFLFLVMLGFVGLVVLAAETMGSI